MTKLGEGSEVIITTLGKVNEVIVVPGTAGTGGPPSGAAGGVLGGSYPNPSFAADMATQAELDAVAAAKQNLDTDLTDIAALSPTNDDIIQRKAGSWVNRTMAQLKTDLAIAWADISGAVSAVNALIATAIGNERTAVATYTGKDFTSGNTFPTFNQSTTGSAATLTTSRTIGILTGDATSAGSGFNGSANNTNAVTLATVNSNVGSFGSASQVSTLTVNGKGLVTAAGQTSIAITASQVSDFSTAADARIAAASATGTGNLVRATSPTLVTPALGTPTQGVLTSCTGLPAAGVVSGTLIGFKAYNGADYFVDWSSLADLDATNLAVTFNAPASGSVLIRLTCSASLDAGVLYFGIRESTTNVVAQRQVPILADLSSCLVNTAFVVTGLTPASSHTYKWAVATTTEAQVLADAAGDRAPAVMEIISLP